MGDTNIRVRPFEKGDSESIRALYMEAVLYDSNSPARFALEHHLKTTPGHILLSMSCLSVLLMLCSLTRISGLLLFLMTTGLLLAWRRKVWNGWFAYCQSAMVEDLADIGAHYGTPPNAFWVAEVVGGKSAGAIVGCIGLDSSTTDDKSTAELRRMAVSPAYQGKGIGEILFGKLVDHDRKEKLTEIFLDTSSYHRKARKFYEMHGFLEVKREPISDELWFIVARAHLHYYVLRL